MKHDEQGIALVIVIFLMGTLSALAVSMMFLAQTETASSRNYRTMSQARYAAGTREILECWFEDQPIREEYLIVDRGNLAGTGAHSYSVRKTS